MKREAALSHGQLFWCFRQAGESDDPAGSHGLGLTKLAGATGVLDV